MSEVRHFFTKIAGVSNYQDVARRLQATDSLALICEPANEHDPNAVQFVTKGGDLVGYFNSHLASEISDRMTRGWQYFAYVSQVTGVKRGQHFGVNVALVVVSPGTDWQSIANYVETLDLSGSDRGRSEPITTEVDISLPAQRRRKGGNAKHVRKSKPKHSPIGIGCIAVIIVLFLMGLIAGVFRR